MTRQIALFRGINVGGRNVLPMATLKDILADLGCCEVQTYIQSGNVVFQHPRVEPSELENMMTAAVEKNLGFAPDVLILSASELAAAIEKNPYRNVVAEEKTIHFLFLSDTANDGAENKIKTLLSPSESCQLVDRVFYLFAPDGIARSKVAVSAEKHLGVPTTGRNLRTVNKLAALAGV